MSRSYRFSTALAAALLFASPVVAQQAPAATLPAASLMVASVPMVVPVAPVQTFGPTIIAAATANPDLTPVPVVMPRSQSVALMIVGGAALIVGSAVHGDTGTIIMAGGAVVGLVGLFNYLR